MRLERDLERLICIGKNIDADAFEQENYQRTFVEADEPSINGTATGTPGSQGQGTLHTG